MLGAFLFILIQLVLLVDFAHGWAEAWVERYEETEAKCYYIGGFVVGGYYYQKGCVPRDKMRNCKDISVQREFAVEPKVGTLCMRQGRSPQGV